jgi:hypothetical protein
MERTKVVVFPAGSEIGLEIFHSLKYSHHIEVHGASGKSDHAELLYPEGRYHEGPFYINEPGFVEIFNQLLTVNEIKFIYPTHDTVANFLSAHQNELVATVIGSCADTNDIARHKRKTYRHFSDKSWCPVLFEELADVTDYPVFLKPDDGQGGKGTKIAYDREELDFYISKNTDLLVMEYLPGEEFSVDCFTDHEGNLIFVGPRTRERVQMGISFRSNATPLSDELLIIATEINERVSLDGAWFFQTKADGDKRQKLIEFAPRQASTMGLYRHTGINFALLSFFNAKKQKVEILQNTYDIMLDRCLHNRFQTDLDYRRVYIDFDETIVDGDTVHERVMAYLYQCKNRGVELILITKHRHSIIESLNRFSISNLLFTEILHLDEHEEKWQHIDPSSAIFIDNYWFDRKAVSEHLNIPVFDVDAIECLLDQRLAVDRSTRSLREV